MSQTSQTIVYKQIGLITNDKTLLSYRRKSILSALNKVAEFVKDDYSKEDLLNFIKQLIDETYSSEMLPINKLAKAKALNVICNKLLQN